MMTCKGICYRYKAHRPMPISLGVSRYAVGQKRCQICEMWMEWEGDRCPCCSIRLRTHPRRRDNKIKFRQVTGVRI